MSECETASFVFSENSHADDTERSFAFVYHSNRPNTFILLLLL